MKKLWSYLCILNIFLLTGNVNALEITNNANITSNNLNMSKLKDNNYKTSSKITDSITITSVDNIKQIYIMYELTSEKGTITYNDKEKKIGENNYLHEYIELDNETKELTINYDSDVTISEIYIFDKEETPDWVQKWTSPKIPADLLLFSTHSDDEQLFFLGLLPTYINKGLEVQVAYLAHHNDNPKRLHEQLNGLWSVGVTRYPSLGIIPDAFSKSLEGAISNLKTANMTEEDVIKYQVETIRKYQPLVVVGHDESGEYSHGQHILNTHALKEAIKRSKDESYYKELNLAPWEIKKLYLHLYNQNTITMNYDVPLDSFDGKTAYEVSKNGYKMHESQQWTWFTKWINGKNNEYTKATDIKTYSPTDFGLYYTSVGNDVNRDDMFENVELRKEKAINKNTEEKRSEETVVAKSVKKQNYTLYIVCASTILILIIGVAIITNKLSK